MKLIAASTDNKSICHNVIGKKFLAMKLLGRMLERLAFVGRSSMLHQRFMNAARIRMNVHEIRSVADVGALLTEQPDGRVRVEPRSNLRPVHGIPKHGKMLAGERV